MERRSRSQTRKANLALSADQQNSIPGQNGLASNTRHASLGRLPTELSALSTNTAVNTLANTGNTGFSTYHSHHHNNLHNRPGGDSRTLSPDRRNNGSGTGGRNFPKTSPHAHKSGSYNQYTHPPPPPLTLPPSTTSSHVALGINGTTAHTNNNHVIGKSSYQLPAPPPRAPMSTSTPQNTPMKLDPRTTTIMNGGMGNGTPQNSSTTSSLSSSTLNNSPKNHGIIKPPIPQPTSPQVGITLSTFDR